MPRIEFDISGAKKNLDYFNVDVFPDIQRTYKDLVALVDNATSYWRDANGKKFRDIMVMLADAVQRDIAQASKESDAFLNRRITIVEKIDHIPF